MQCPICRYGLMEEVLPLHWWCPRCHFSFHRLTLPEVLRQSIVDHITLLRGRIAERSAAQAMQATSIGETPDASAGSADEPSAESAAQHTPVTAQQTLSSVSQ